MKEILYIQAGSLANYAGTHFWNTQESYFTYGEEADSEICHDISFREGLNRKGEPTFCPRLLAFDRKSNFGALSQTNALYGTDDDSDMEKEVLWSDDPVEYKQEQARQSHYQTNMENSVSVGGDAIQLQDVQYWSDFNRLFYIPRTIQKIPDIPDWEEAEGNWSAGHDEFIRFDQDTGLMEGPLRLFLEECETIQGIQLVQDTSTFGSFINSFLTSLRDEFGKLPILAWPLLSDAAASGVVDTKRGTQKTINDALVLRGLSELSSMSIPIQHPATWADEVFSNSYIHASRTHAYHTSAILSAHIETATLPLRLNGTQDDISRVIGQLTWRSTSPFAELGGIFPNADTLDLGRHIYNFSSSHVSKSVFGRRVVTRGLSLLGITSYDEWLSPNSGGNSSTIFSAHAAAYPLPTSFPSFFRPKAPDNVVPMLQRGSHPGILSRPPLTTVFSSITTSSGTAHLLAQYARFVEDCARRNGLVSHVGMDVDDMGDLANDLWTLHDNAGGGDGVDDSSDVDVHGEDED